MEYPFFHSYYDSSSDIDMGFLNKPHIEFNIPKDKKIYNKTHFIIEGTLYKPYIYYKTDYILDNLTYYSFSRDSINIDINYTFDPTNATWNIIYNENDSVCTLNISIYDIWKDNGRFWQNSAKYLFEFSFVDGDNFLFYKLFYFIMHKFTKKFEQYESEPKEERRRVVVLV